MALTVSAQIQRWPIAGTFSISRGAKTEAVVVVAQLTDGVVTGRGECVPYARYGETPESVLAAIEATAPAIAAGLGRDGLQARLPAGAARNALDCALWDHDAKRSGRTVAEIAGLSPVSPCPTAYTISIGSPEAMAEAAAAAEARPLLKIKLGQDGDPARIAAVRRTAPRAELIVDANEGWTAGNLAENLAACVAAGVTLIEQPLPAGHDAALAGMDRPIPICADESVHDRSTLPALRDRYDAINIKLDKTGGLTEALALADAARKLDFAIMIGCMVGTSLAMAPALHLAAGARVIDLDGPLLLARDRPEGLDYHGSIVQPPSPLLWG